MAQTLAELVLKIRSDDTAKIKKDLADIETALKRIEAQAARSMRGFNAQQARLLRGQVGQTSGGGGNVMAGTAQALREVTKELERMGRPLNAAIDGFTQIGQILTNKSVTQSLSKISSPTSIPRRPSEPFSWSGWLRRMEQQGRRTSWFDERMATFREKLPNIPGLGRIMNSNSGYMTMVRGLLASHPDFGDLRKVASQSKLGTLYRASKKGAAGFREGVGDAFGIESTFGAASSAALVLAGALTAASTQLVNYAKQASIASVERESLRARLGGLDRKGSTVDQMIGLAREVAGPSKFTTKQMLEGTTSLLSFGLNAERILPLIGKLGNAFGAGPEQLSMYTNAFGQLAGGQLPDIQVLNQMGITKAQLKAGGVKFDKGGSLLSSTELVMTQMEKIINDKYKKVTQLMMSTTEATRANIQDSLDNIQLAFGDAINNGLAPFEASLATVLSGIETSKFPEVIARDLLSPLMSLKRGVTDLNQAFREMIAYAMAIGTAIPRQLATAADEWKNVSKSQNFGGGLQRVGSRSMTILRFLGGLFDPTGSGLGATANIGDTAAKYLKSMNEQATKNVESNKKRLKDPFGGILPFKGDDSGSDKSKAKRTLEKIENNTRKSAELLDLRRQTIGGGEIAALGITGAEIAGMGLKNRSEISLRSPIRPDTQVIRGIKDLVYGNMNFALQGSPINRVRF